MYILIKTFFGERNYYCACVTITTLLKHLLKLITEASCENPKVLHNIRFINPICSLNELKDHNQSLADLNI